MTLSLVGCFNERCFLRSRCYRYTNADNCETLRRFAPDGPFCINYLEIKNDTERMDDPAQNV